MDILSKFKKWNKADYVLLAAVGVFLLAVAVKMSYPETVAAKLFLIVAEAGLVGGIADWFAVTALFRRPLGFPYHTALVPRNRKRLIEELSKAVEEDFLSKETIKKHLFSTNLTDCFISKIENIGSEKAMPFVRKIMIRLIRKSVAMLDPAHIGYCGGEFIKKTLRDEPITPYLAKTAQWAANTGKTALLYDFVLDRMYKFINRPETQQKIYSYLQNVKNTSSNRSWISNFVTWIMEETDSLNLNEAANSLQAEIIATLEDIKAINHPFRHWVLSQMEVIANSLSDNAAWSEAAESGKTAFLSKLDLAAPLTEAITSLQKIAAESYPDQQNVLEEKIICFLTSEGVKYWQIFKNDPQLKENTEEFFHYLANSLLETNHSLIGTVVKDALSRLTDEDFVLFVEEKASDDLAWIRINGVVVGSLAGFLLGLLLHFVYDPFLLLILP